MRLSPCLAALPLLACAALYSQIPSASAAASRAHSHPLEAATMPNANTAAQGQFQKLATFKGLGGVPNSMVGPGPTPGSQRLYQSYMYVANTIELVAVDPANGHVNVYENPAPTENGAWAMAVGDDGDIYLGTLPNAHMLQFDPRTDKFVDLGRPSSTEQYIWNLAVGTDHKIYGCTYPGAKLVSYDPATGKTSDLGRMDPTEQYARFIAASSDGYIYVGIGTSKMNIAAYNIATGTHEEILPAANQVTGIANVYRAVDGNVYGVAGKSTYRLSGGKAILLADDDKAPDALPKNQFADGHTIDVSDGQVVITNPKTKKEARYPYTYAGRAISVFRVSEGPDGEVYGNSVLPAYLFRLDPKTDEIKTYGLIAGGEAYSLLAHDGKVLIANYSGDSVLMSFDPKKPYKRGENPTKVDFTGSDHAWRPQAMIAGGDGKIYVGAVSGYGKLGGTLAVWDTSDNHVQAFPNIIADESPVSLAWDGGLLYGGTTISGGGGSHTTQTDATLFIFDPKTQKVVFKTQPVPGEKSITDLIVSNGKLYGFAGKTLFVFDTATRTVTKTVPTDFSGLMYNSIAPGPDGLLWGLTTNGIFTLDPNTDAARLVAKAPADIYGGFMLKGNDIYFSCNADIYRYRIPAK